jgi:MFS family permease
MSAHSPRVSTGWSTNFVADEKANPQARVSVDRATRLTLLQLGMWGYFLYAFGPSVPFLRDDLGISSALAGLHPTAMSGGAILAGIFGVRLVRRFGRGRVRWLGVTSLAIGTVIYVAAPSVAWSMLAVLVAGTGGSFIVNTTNVALLAHHGARGPMWATYAHAFAASVGIAGPALIGVSVAIGFGWRPAFFMVPASAILIAWLLRGARMRGDTVAHEQDGHPTTGGRLTGRFWWVLAGLLLSTAAEFSMTLWSTDLVRQNHGLDDASAAWSFSVLLLGLTLARWLSAAVTARLGSAKLIGAGLLVMFFGLLLLLLVPTPGMAFVAMFIIGVGMGPQYPMVIALALRAAGSAADRASSVTSVAIGLIIATAPFALGAAADRVGVVTAFYAVPAAVIASFLALTVARSARLR